MCTDRAASGIGCESGVTVKIKEVATRSIYALLYIIHRQLLSAKKLFPELNDIINGAIKMVNDIDGHALHFRISVALRVSMGSLKKVIS